jgi:hypothetical protein
MSKDISSSLINNDSKWYNKPTSTGSLPTAQRSPVQSHGQPASSGSAIPGPASTDRKGKIEAVKQLSAGVVKADVFDEQNMVSLRQINPNSDPLKKNDAVGQQTYAVPGRCVENTARITDQTGTVTLKSARTPNHTMCAMNDCYEQGWRILKDADPGNAPTGSIVFSMSERTSQNSPYGSDTGVLTAGSNGKRFVGGKEGSSGAYEVAKDNPDATVYGSSGKTVVMVPPGAVTA